jgi:hypothetical protein
VRLALTAEGAYDGAPPPMNDRLIQVASALEATGTHRSVQLEVTDVSVAGDTVVIELVLRYARATPVCCDQPGCYLRFLGLARERVPEAIGAVLGVVSPAVTIRAQLSHEPGYRHVDHATGRPTDAGVDQLQIYGPDHFSSAPRPSREA